MKVYIGETCVITRLGDTTESNYNEMLKGKSGLMATHLPYLVDTVLPIQTIDAQAENGLSRLESLMKRAIDSVIEKSGINPHSARTGIIFSTTKGNIDHLTTDTPNTTSDVFLDVMAQNICKAVGIDSQPVIISNACISGVSAAIVAQRLIKASKYDNIIVAGGDEVTEFTTSGFLAFKSVSAHPCRPYDAERDGLSLGEAVSAIIVTNDEKLSSGIVISGGSMTNDANHISGPSRTGEPLAHAITEALKEANVEPADISFVNAHGTATVYNDEMESKAINIANLQDVPLNSLKPYIGHTLGASGVVEIAIAAKELLNGTIIGTMGFANTGTPISLNISSENRCVEMKHCVKTASGFGGCNAAVVLSLEKDSNSSSGEATFLPKPIKAVSSVSMKEGRLTVNGNTTLLPSDFNTFIREIYHQQEPNMKFFKMSDMCKMGYLGASYLLTGIDYNPYDIAIVLANRSASLDADLKHWRIMHKDGLPASPAAFVYTLPNIVMGEMAIRHGIKGETTFFVTNNPSDESIAQYAQLLLNESRYKYIITGWCELLEDKYELNIKLITQ